MSSTGGSVTQFASRGRAGQSPRASRTFPHGKLLLSRARRELAALERLASLSASLPLANEAWRILLRILVDTLQGRGVTISRLARELGITSDIAVRYLRALESERLVMICAMSGESAGAVRQERPPHSATAGQLGFGDGTVTIGDEGILRVARYFLPEAANE